MCALLFVRAAFGVDDTFSTIPTIGIPRGGSFSFSPEPIAVKLLILVGLGNLTIPPGKYTHLLIICHLSASIFLRCILAVPGVS